MSNLAEPIGEAWMTGSGCLFANGPFAGKTLGEAWKAMPPEWTGTQIDRTAGFPLLVKFIFPEEKLSVQVHPDDAYAAKHEQAAGGRGKTEMWYAVRARPGAEVLVGLKPDVTVELFKSAIADSTAEQCLEHVPVKQGEAIFVPAGTAHTIGPGLVLCEIQEYSDLTYRVYDYDRRDAQGRARDLHIEKALEVMRFGKQKGGKVQPVRHERGPFAETYFVACEYFATERWDLSHSVGATPSLERFELLIFLAGSGSISWGTESADYAPAQVWMIPAALGQFRLLPEETTSLLRTYVPGGLADFTRQLVARGVPESAVLRIVHS